MGKTFYAKFERFKKRRMNRSYSFGKGFGRRKKMKRKMMGFAIVFNVLQERIKEMPVLFRNRGSERFDRGEHSPSLAIPAKAGIHRGRRRLVGSLDPCFRRGGGMGGFGRGHRHFFKSSPKNANQQPNSDCQDHPRRGTPADRRGDNTRPTQGP
jgi:hypothetical protein